MSSTYKIAIPIFLLTISFYIFTLSPSLAWGDGVRLQSEAISGQSFLLAEMTPQEFTPDPFPFSRVGITAWDHPLYIELGYTLVKALPFVDSLWLVNLISAIFGAGAITVVFVLSYQCTKSLWIASYTALALAVSHTFWWHSSTPEVYSLFVFLLLLSFYFFHQFEATGDYSMLTVSAFFFGLALADHIMAVLALPALGLYFLIARNFTTLIGRDLRKLIAPSSALVVGFSLYIVQFIRLFDKFSLGKFIGSAVGSTFLHGLGVFSPAVLAQSILTYLIFLFINFGPIGIILGALGIRKAFQNSDPFPWKVVAFYVVYTIFGIFYHVTDQFAFFMTSHVFFALLMGIGAGYVFSIWDRWRLVLSLALILTILLAPPFYRILPRLMEDQGLRDAFLHIPQIGTGLRDGLAYYIDPNKRGDFNAYNFGNETISKLAPNAVVIAEWYTDTDEYFILRYFHKIRGVRPDVTILGWPTNDPFSFDSQLVLDEVKDSIPTRPVYLASLSDRFYAASKLIETYCILPENDLYRVYQRHNDNLQCLKEDSITE
jgi:hypothetical protein